MAIFIDNREKLKDLLRRKINAGIGSTVRILADMYKQDISQKTVTPSYRQYPEVLHRGRGDGIYRGGELVATVQRSAPGEFPYKETQEGLRSVTTAVNTDSMSGAMGVDDSGEHLIHLTYGSHPYGQPFERLGGADTLKQNINQLRLVFLQAMRAKR